MLHEQIYLKNTDQVSSGEMMIQTLQVSPGELQEQEPQIFYTTHQYFEEININIIEPFNQIPDYLGETINPYPTILNTSGRYICLDGWHLLEEARQKQQETIRCLIEVANNCPDEEIALRKVATRMLPSNGKCTYLETIRNIKELYKILTNTRENLVCFHHGGHRRGNEFINNREENVRLVLATRLGKSPNTISKYLNHGEFLNDNAASELMATTHDQVVKPNKQFFEIAQSNKNKMLVVLKSEGMPENEITEKLSGYVLQMFNEYKRTGRIENYASAQVLTLEDSSGVEAPADDVDQNTIAEKFLPKPFHYYTGNQLSPEQVSFNIDDVKAEITTIAENMLSLSRVQNAQVSQIIAYITVSISCLSQCLQKCRTIYLNNINNEGGNSIWVN